MDWDLQMEAMSSYVVESAKNITVAISEAIPDDIHQHLELTRNAYESTITAIRLWGLVFLPVFNFLYWLVVSVWNVVLPILPPIWEALKSAAAYIWQLFLIHVWPSIHIRLMHMKRKLSQADPPTVAFTIATMFILVMVLSKIRSFIRAGYLKRLRVYAVQKARDMNRMVKKMLSGLGASTFHVCIFAHALLTVFHYLPEAATEPLSHPALFWLVTLCYPAYATLCAVHQYRVADPRPSTLNNLNRWLTYWTVIVALGVVLQVCRFL
ncbi:hypothetical protein SARC_03007 [Sphaeroforma arctica JP610]|uniref:Uncharacterized protein n=1 Tax=Sphaeroforma arctica JP610 TaxID=667725 RepID=A0A0L0G7A0_9EUKA|nr:hypothetical protein SARC_03007 [Sphaeroforma arctica JP610]KNC84799.1 hypothetical protein SARC_03007 [Sphaeroforma arctica JP610]|eukprot:XP_014158701.1 hypothetical protein SARC_03007 [Sphaeroforma arctica JP610]